MKTILNLPEKWNYLLLIIVAFTTSNLLEAQTITSIMSSYNGYDINADRVNEIDQLTYLPFENSYERVSSTEKLVLVLVEDRILESITGSSLSEQELLKRLEQYKDDLKAEGYTTKFIKASIYDGTEHQDGRTLLAIRSFLKDIKQSKNLQGVILVGAFPEAMIVRRWIWRRKNWNVTIDGTDYTGNNQRDFLRIVPEIVAHRADIVLADLDGNWKNIYVKGPVDLESIEALPVSGTNSNWPLYAMTFTSTKYNDQVMSFQDFFWIQDDNFQRLSAPSGTLKLRIRKAQKHPETNFRDRAKPNPIARPEIFVSRINARNIAVSTDKNFVDASNQGLLDVSGKPRTLETNQNVDPRSFLRKDPITERKILINYFDRNHSYRVGGNPLNSHRTGAVKFGTGLISASNLNNYLKKASSNFSSSITYNEASLVDYVKFLKTPATLKGMSSHSDPWGSEYGNSYNVNELENLVGGKPWLWKKEAISSGYRYTPSLVGLNGKADAYIHRTIYENNILSGTGGNLFIHNGCEVNSPGNASRRPYNHKDYGSSSGLQNAESILFFLNGVALASRAKVFYDKPEGFTEEIGKNKKNHFGAGWKAYFTKESNDADLASNVSGNKRTYTWSITGDWTARVKYDNGLGILKFEGNNLKNYSVHANQSWFGGWNFDSNLNNIKGKGDFNGDGIDDILINSSWGIGVLSRIGNQWKSIVAKPKDSWFGGWRYGVADKIEAIADFDNDGKDEILITSNWGIAILKLQGNTFRSILVKPNGTRFGTWTYNTTTVRDNKIEGVGDFNGDGKVDILVSKPYGIALLTMSGSTLQSIVVKPNDSWFGGWRYGVSNKIEAIADFDNDGKDEILITSNWGIGMLKLQGNTFKSILVKPNGTRFGTWTYNTTTVRDNKIEGVGDFNGDGKADILVSKPYGIALLTLSGTTLNSIVVKPVGTQFGQWTYNTRSVYDNKVEKIGDFNGDGKADILMSKPYGIGVLSLSGNTFTSLYIKRNNTQIGDWHLKVSNSFPVIGNFDEQPGEEIIIYK
ncbi:repeat domain in Vibrio, Colwellia, Bradyrhizobium and Shewanella [Kordia sp. SMS9]|uniref:FG-GAP repeat domain-containing protein n=1 Tax=Kordia sp. SMS9 TaxID=2282170 RepID=UPI000E0D8790|nr:VCBS repeat-containing protein [Kordia sp. SMS9]AXG70567.1 repeat domain in Vibrio, Colwellia, Bradyrhizobium and Shewanella [Kordia sp. SMS9]